MKTMGNYSRSEVAFCASGGKKMSSRKEIKEERPRVGLGLEMETFPIQYPDIPRLLQLLCRSDEFEVELM